MDSSAAASNHTNHSSTASASKGSSLHQVRENTKCSEKNINQDIEEIYENEREQSKIRNWKESPYAVGLVEATWSDELSRFHSRSNAGSAGPCLCSCDDETDPTCGCIKLSAIVCTKLGAKRIGNMAILKESVERVVEEGHTDYERNLEMGLNSTSSKRTRLVFRRKMDIVVGPYWPMLVFITYPLIFTVSLWTAVEALPGKPPLFIIFWCICTVSLCLALFATGCRDPGILLRIRDQPLSEDSSRWRWNDQALTWRPRGSMYDSDCACVVEKFDHTCPWTGTAIGKRNFAAFQIFVALVFVMLLMDTILLLQTALMKNAEV